MELHNNPQTTKVIDYYKSIESRLVYLFLRGYKHFGYYPKNKENIPTTKAQQLMIEKLYQEIGINKDAYCLDAGCGEGKTANYLAKKYNYNISGIDILDFNLKKAVAESEKLNIAEKVNYQLMNYENLLFEDNVFDCVYTLETLVHAADYKKALREFNRVLKPGGSLILFEYVVKPLEELAAKMRKNEEIIIKESGMHSLPYFTYDNFQKQIEEEKFIDVSIEDITSNVMPFIKKSYKTSFFPYVLISLFGVRKHFPNVTAAFNSFKIAKEDLMRYYILKAKKSELIYNKKYYGKRKN